MLRIWLSVSVLLLLAACASAPEQQASTRAGSGVRITVPRAFAPPAGFPHFVDHSVGREEISIQAMSLVGVPYRWGGNTPDSGFDCSGFVRYVVARAASVDLPRTSSDMSERGVPIEPDQIATGDLVFFNTTGRPHSHVGIYVGKLRFIDAPSTGGTVRLDYLSNPYWASHFDGIRRVAAPAEPFDTPVYEARNTLAVTPVAMPRQAAAPDRLTADNAVADQPATTLAPVAASQQAATPPAAPLAAAPAASGTPDPIDAAADAFEPPPPTAAAAALQAQSVESGRFTAPAATDSDPIAQFAHADN